MSPAETARVLAAAAAFDQRTVGQSDVAAWHAALCDVEYVDATNAVVRHYRSTRDRIMPVDILRHASLIASERRRVAEYEGAVWEMADGHEFELAADEGAVVCQHCKLPQPNRRHRRVAAKIGAA